MAVILVGGTWSNDLEHDFWWIIGSPFYQEIVKRGFECYSYAWNTHLDGVIGENTDWEKAGKRMSETVPKDSIVIAHSHGGNVAAYAAIDGLRMKKLITIATPVRPDVNYEFAKTEIKKWIHIYGNFMDYWQILGELALGKFWKLNRKMKFADENIFYPAAHSELHFVRVWNEENWWDLLNDS